MARGRIITNAICGDKRINQLSNDTSRLAFTWLVTFADCEGRTHGDPAMLRSMLFPRRDDISLAHMKQFVTEWARLGLVIWYEADGDRWIYFPAFEKNQPGLNKTREAPSRIPAPPEIMHPAAPATPVPSADSCNDDKSTPDQLLSNSGLTPANGMEVNVSEKKCVAQDAPTHSDAKAEKKTKQPRKGGRSALAGLWHQNTNVWPNKFQEEAMIEMVKDSHLFAQCIQTACLRGVSPKNVELVLEWYKDGGPPPNGKPQTPPPPKREKQLREYEYIDPMSGERRKAEAMV